MNNKIQEHTLETGFRSPCGLDFSANAATLLGQGWQIRHICSEAIELADQDVLQAGAWVVCVVVHTLRKHAVTKIIRHVQAALY